MMTVKEIIDLAGGPVAIAQALTKQGRRTTPSAVYKWANFSDLGIPEKYWGTVIKLAGKRVTPEKLHQANELRRSKRAEH